VIKPQTNDMMAGFEITQPISVVKSRYFCMFRCLPFICKL